MTKKYTRKEIREFMVILVVTIISSAMLATWGQTRPYLPIMVLLIIGAMLFVMVCWGIEHACDDD